MEQLTLVVMTDEQAIDWKNRFGRAGLAFRDLLMEGWEGQVWNPLGFPNWTSCLEQLAEEFGFSARHAWRELEAAKIEKNLLTNWSVDNNRIPESRLRPLSGLEPDEQREVWQEAVRSAPNGKVTAAHVEQVVRDKLPKAMVYERTETLGGVVECSRCNRIYDGSKIEYCPYCAYTQEQRIQYLRHEQEKSKVEPKQQVHYSSETPEWYTPQVIIDRVIKVMGQIDLDPCSNSHDSPNVPATQHYTQKDDGLSKKWRGRVYMNPPYGREIADWINQLIKEWDAGRLDEAIALVPARTDTVWFRWLRRFPRCFVWGRLRFSESENSAPFPSMAVYLGDNLNQFIAAFGDIGDIYQRVEYERQ